MSDYTTKQLQEISNDRDWWQSAGAVVGLSLVGWTYRSSALFRNENAEKSVEMNGLMAKCLIELRAALDRAEAEVAELNEVFGAQWAADQRASAEWRAANPGNDLTWPDSVRLSAWALATRDLAVARLDDVEKRAEADKAAAVDALDGLFDAITATDQVGDRKLTITGSTANLKWLLDAEDDAQLILAAARAQAPQ